MRKQLERASARSLGASRTRSPKAPSCRAQQVGSDGSHSSDSSSHGGSSGSSRCTGRAGGRLEGRGGHGQARWQDAHQHRQRHGGLAEEDVALAPLRQARQPSSIASLQQQLQELGEAVEGRGPRALRHKPAAPASRGADPVADAAAKVSQRLLCGIGWRR